MVRNWGPLKKIITRKFPLNTFILRMWSLV
jgi:hypothetical protein